MPSKIEKHDRSHRNSSSSSSHTHSEKRPAVKKTAPATISDITAAEEIAAKEFDLETNRAKHKQLCTSLAEKLKELQRARRHDKEDAISSLKTEILSHFVQLKRFNRLAHLRNKLARDTTTQERQKLEGPYLQLQNLLYEVLHVKKEVTKCLEFKSAHESIDLVPVEEFFATAPPELANPEVTMNDPHQLRLARLNFELEERKRLEKILEDLEQEDAKLAADIKKDDEICDSLLPKLNGILEAARPLQQLIGVDYEKATTLCERAAYLPTALYIVYNVVLAYKEHVDDALDVMIDGDVDEAKDVDNSRPNTPDGESDDSDAEDAFGPDSSDGKHNHIRLGARRKTLTESLEENRQHVLAVSPLSLSLKKTFAGIGSANLAISFLPSLSVLCAKCTSEPQAAAPKAVAVPRNFWSSATLLTNLLGSDSGKTCPNPVAVHKLNHLKYVLLQDSFRLVELLGRLVCVDHQRINFDEATESLGGTFAWLQELAGLQFAKTSSDDAASSAAAAKPVFSYAGCTMLQNALDALHDRFRARFALQKQLAALESLDLLAISQACRGLFPMRILSKLTSFRLITFDDIKAKEYSQFALERGLIGSDGWHFEFSLERSEVKLAGVVQVSLEYPNVHPLFCVGTTHTASDPSSLDEIDRDLEFMINVEFPRVAACIAKNDLLHCQIVQLASAVEVVFDALSDGLNSSSGPSRSRLFERRNKGRNHKLPFFYDQESQMFTFVDSIAKNKG